MIRQNIDLETIFATNTSDEGAGWTEKLDCT